MLDRFLPLRDEARNRSAERLCIGAAVLFLFFLFACNNIPKNPNDNEALSEVKTDMNMKAVEDLAGKPATVQDLGVATSETGDTTHLVQWNYGNNQNVMFTNGKVSGVDLDMKASQEKVQHIMDSARAAEGGGSTPMIQPEQK